MKVISDMIFDIGDLRSGHFCDLPIISQWAKNQLCYIFMLQDIHCKPENENQLSFATHGEGICNYDPFLSSRDLGLT